jgi:hypothetical protein
MRQRWLKNSSEACVERVIAAVGTDIVPVDFSGTALLRCLELSWQWYCSALAFSMAKSEEDRKQRLSRAHKIAKGLERLLAPDDVWQSLFAPLPPDESIRHGISDLARLIDKRLVEEAQDEAQGGPFKAYRDSFKTRSPFEWLAGNFLADVYFFTFGCRVPGISENGPYVRFAEIILDEFQVLRNGKPYSRASIAKALRNDRRGLTRRKTNPPHKDPYRFWRQGLLFKAVSPSSPPEPQSD